jgi:spore coat polysaccharide biosynthesis protein SpsF
VATTEAPEDQAIIEFARGSSVGSFEGSTHDVLDRFYQAARLHRADIIVRITADDPFKDPGVIDLIVDALGDDPSLDYASNTLEPTFPEGIDVEVFTMVALEKAWNEAALTSEREHVTPYIWKHPEKFRLKSVRHGVDLSALRWTLDYEEDLRFTTEIYHRLYRGQVFGMQEILDLLEAEPALKTINTGIVRNAGYLAHVSREEASA